MILTNSAFAQPYAFTQAAGPLTVTNATLNGMVTPRGLPTTAWFEWGTDDSYGQVTSPVDAGSGTNVIRLSAYVEGLFPDSVYFCRVVASNSTGVNYGWEHRLTTGRHVVSWGEAVVSLPGSMLPPTGLGNVVDLAAGDYHGLALKADGTVVTWGHYNISSAPFLPPAGLSNVIAVAGGRDHSLALKHDGRVVVWGDNSSSQTNVPASLSNVVAISAGDVHCLALRSNGTLAVWGQMPSIPNGLGNVVAIASGDIYCLALRNNGTVAAWGNNPFGQANVPAGLSNVVAIAAGYQYSLALKSNGTVVGWGSGAGTNVPAGLSNVVQIAAGDKHGLALQRDGMVIAWGTTESFGGINPPSGLTDVVKLSCGDEFSMALAANTPPEAMSRTLTGPINRDSVLFLANLTRERNGDLLARRIPSPPTSGTLYQFDGGGRGTAITESGTPVLDAAGRVIFAPASDEFGAPYTSFSVVANDGEFDSAPSLATVNIIPAPLVSIVGPEQSSNRVVLSFLGLSNVTYRVWSSTNLINWSLLGSASQPFPGQFLYTDVSVANQPRRFFQVRVP